MTNPLFLVHILRGLVLVLVQTAKTLVNHIEEAAKEGDRPEYALNGLLAPRARQVRLERIETNMATAYSLTVTTRWATRVFIPPIPGYYVTKFSPQKAIKLIASG